MAYDILIIDDEQDIRNLVSGLLEDEGYQTRVAGNSQEAFSVIEARRPNLILLDIWLHGSDLDGLGILKKIKKNHSQLPVLMMSGHGTVEMAVSAIQDGAFDFIEKPFKSDRLLHLVNRALETTRLRQENEELKVYTGPRDELFGDSSIIKEIRHSISKVAKANSRLLITGPSGSGKEVAARLIHNQSSRSAGPFIVINCAIIQPDHAEVELFGTEGNPDQNIEHGVGTFEAAHNGTLFLDEVSDMPLETQGKIVRTLLDQVFERVGGKRKVEVDVRVIASTTQNLPEMIAEKRFREDLYYRLNVVPINMPSLVSRKEDIPILARHFMIKAAEASGHQPREIGEDAIAGLQSHSWPGNVRELKNTIERMLIMAPGTADQAIGADMLPPEIRDLSTTTQQWDKSAEIMGRPLREAREMFERDYLLAQLNRFGGNISRTAEFVGMERSALHRKLKTLGVKDKK